MNIDLNWIDGVQFSAHDENGHSLSTDGSAAIGGADAGWRPMALVLAGLASCMAIEVVLMIKKTRVQLHSCRIKVRAERAEDIPKVFRLIHLDCEIDAPGLSRAQADRLLSLAVEKYCSVAAMLRPAVQITSAHNVQD